MLFDKIDPFVFVLSFFVGLMICFYMDPIKEIIVKFPSPINAENTIYKNEKGRCYKYNVNKTECPLDKTLIKSQPL